MDEKQIFEQIYNYYAATEERKAFLKQFWRENRFEADLTRCLADWTIINMSDFNYDSCNVYHVRKMDASNAELRLYVSFISPVYDIIVGRRSNQTRQFQPKQSIRNTSPYREAITSIETLLDSQGLSLWRNTWDNIQLPEEIKTELSNRPTISACLFQDYS